MIETDKDSKRIQDFAANVAEHFDDYVIIGRVKDGLVWRFSDRTFALGAICRLQEKLGIDDRLGYAEGHNDD